MRALVILVVTIAITACTSVKVQPVDASLDMRHVCIQENRKVIVEGFLPMLEEDFARHGISTQVISDSRTCEYVLTYTALRSWDLTVYLSHAELHLFRNGQQIASAEYHLNGKGGLALTKFKSTESKMDGVMDQLLAGYDADSNASFESDTVYSQNVYAELQQLDALRSRGIITEAEFDEEKRELLDSN